MQKRHERVPMDKILKALKVYFYKIIHENCKLNLSFFVILSFLKERCSMFDLKKKEKKGQLNVTSSSSPA